MLLPYITAEPHPKDDSSPASGWRLFSSPAPPGPFYCILHHIPDLWDTSKNSTSSWRAGQEELGTVGAAPWAVLAWPCHCRRWNGWQRAVVSPLHTVKCLSTSPSPSMEKGSATSRQDRRRERLCRENIPSPTLPLLPPELSLSQNTDLSQDANKQTKNPTKAGRAVGRKVFGSLKQSLRGSLVSNSPLAVCYFLCSSLIFIPKESGDQPAEP